MIKLNRRIKNLERNKTIHGITLISLVITIILLIILAGIVINLSIGENGLFNKAKQAKAKYNETSARERLEVVLAEAFVEKETNTKYDSENFLSDLLTNDNMSVNENTVTVDNYNFLIDREKLKIVESLGETQVKVTSEIKEYLGKGESEKYRVSSLIIIKSNIGIESIKITNPDGTNITLTTDKQELTKDIEMELDQEYKIETKTKDGKTDTRIIVEKSEEKIRSVEDLVAFRDKVNSGLTYEGKTLKLTTDLDLSSICGEDIGSFEPIGNINTNQYFKGTFDGNYNTISNLYINLSTVRNNGLFTKNYGTIQNIIVKDAKVNSKWIHDTDSTSEGIVSGGNYGTISNCAVIGNSIVSFNYDDTDTVTTWLLSIGGVTGTCSLGGVIENCSNEAIVKIYVKNANSANKVVRVGGIVGSVMRNGNVTNCYNKGNIEINAPSTYFSQGIGGIVGESETGNTIVNNNYNIGTITISGISKTNIGAIVGFKNSSTINASNNYYSNSLGLTDSLANANAISTTQMKTNTFTNLLNATQTYSSSIEWKGEYIQSDNNLWILDENKNEGYPILKWQGQITL